MAHPQSHSDRGRNLIKVIELELKWSGRPLFLQHRTMVDLPTGSAVGMFINGKHWSTHGYGYLGIWVRRWVPGEDGADGVQPQLDGHLSVHDISGELRSSEHYGRGWLPHLLTQANLPNWYVRLTTPTSLVVTFTPLLRGEDVRLQIHDGPESRYHRPNVCALNSI